MCWGDPADAWTRMIDFKESTYEKTKLVSNLPLYHRESDIGGASEANLQPGEVEICRGDETFLIHWGPSGWKVWCFDKNIQMANEDLGYRSLRLKNPQSAYCPMCREAFAQSSLSFLRCFTALCQCQKKAQTYDGGTYVDCRRLQM